ncbi:hypothetical protein GSI_04348 [Ganoderma sinense ZZ0214-1]|uniref:Uncharacterized protein n=1 Tax=Ganoderma sinense ZZ0214-1 TaxID=1077348 RepID=A0A2G8SIX0_9APHY|nr:hypothetical protein GSI_04348 [Ganoderma sinense ZZ0214-1]
MASCSFCARETCDVPLERDTNFKYSQGDIYGLKESVYTPIYDILVQTFSNLTGESDALKRSQQSLNWLTRVPNVIKDCRPAVVMRDDDDNRLGLTVCVATTYGDEDISNLPFIFRHFSIPFALNGQSSSEHHVHALPECDRKNAYIFAWQFRSKATRDGLWSVHADGEPEKVPQVLGRDAMEFLVKESARRKEEWENMCKDPGVAAEFETQLRDHVQKRREQKFVDGGASTTSLNSVATPGVDSGWWRRPIPGPPTIPEESEDNAVPGNQPDPWKQVTTKHRPRSIHSVSSAFSAFSKKKDHKKGDQWDKVSIKSNHSRSSFSHKPSNRGGTCNFDLLLGMRQR